MSSFDDLTAHAAITVQSVARGFRDRPDAWAWERAFWADVYAAAELAERRRETGRPRDVAFTLPPLSDVQPARVEQEAQAVLVALRRLHGDGTFGDRVTGLWASLMADVANERDATLRRLREPNPWQLALVGGRVVTRERPG